MAYDDYSEQTGQPDDANDDGARRKMMEFILRSAVKPSLPKMNEGAAPGLPEPNAPLSGDYGEGALRRLGVTSPSLNRSSVLGAQPSPAPSTLAPQRSDYQPKPELSGWKKYLGLGLATLAGSPQVTEQVLHGQRDKAESEYQKDVQQYERGQADQVRQAQIRNINSEIEARKNPKPDKPENLDREAYDFYVAGGMSPAEARKQVLKDAAEAKPEKPDTETQEAQRYEGIQTNLRLKRPVSDEDKAWSGSYEKRKTLGPFATATAQAPQKSSERSDKSFTYNNTALDKVSTPIDQAQARLGRLNDAIKQNTPQADALIAPELLSVMAGGAGSGLRMNEAEINRIVGGRSNWESLKAAANKWSLDPKSALSITPEQRREIRALTQEVQRKLTAKSQIIDDSRNSLIDTDDPKEHRRIVADAKKKLDAIDSGAAADGQVQVTDPSGGVHTFPDQASADKFKKLAGIQ